MHSPNYEAQLPIIIGDIYRNWRAAIDAIAKSYNLTRTQWHIIGKLDCRGPKLSQAQLCELVGISHAQLTRALNHLEDNGMIIRRVDKKNRRTKHIELKNPDAQYIQDMNTINTKINDLILNSFTDKQQQQLTQLLTQVRTITQDIQSNIS